MRVHSRFCRRLHRLPSVPLLFALGCLAAAEPLQAQEREVLRAPGLERSVEILVDRWGVPHIYAETEPDLFFAQGWMAARHRLFQLEMWRRQVTGTLSEVLGPRTLDKDRGARLLRYRGDLERELSHYHPRGPEIFGSFVRGINAYVARTEENPDLLPLEFRILDLRPGRWTPEVVVSRLNGLFGNLTAEVRYAQLLQVVDAETLKEIHDFTPADPDLSTHGVDLSLITDEIVHLYRAARAPVEFVREDVEPAHRAGAGADGGAADDGPAAAPSAWDPDWTDREWGSNNWVVSGRRTLSQRTMFANDPHRSISVPPLRWVVHLVGPGWNVMGSTEPTVPGVSMGHNEHGAFGLTIHGRDMEDLYVYDTHPDDPHLYRYQGRWEEMTVIREEIPVEGRAPETVELEFTRHGPVLHEDREHRKAYALRAAWHAPGGAPYLADLRYGQARSWEEFRDGASYHTAPAHNIVWADVHGDFGWQVSGFAPIRPNWSGLLPVPGDGRFEWDGILPVKELPHAKNPDEGFFASANEHNVPPEYPYAFAYDYSEPFRSARIHELLSDDERRLTVLDHHAFQHDQLSIPARQLVPLLGALETQENRVAQAVDSLRGWDRVLDAESVPAAIYVAWERRLREGVAERHVPAAARELGFRVSTVRVLEWLTSPDGRFGDDPVSGRDAFLLEALRGALDDLEGRLGPEMSGWQYGQERFHHVLIRHQLSEVVRPDLRDRLDVGPAPRGGTGYTVNPTSYGDNQTSGPSYRMIAESGNWDRTIGITSPGQSGDPESPHYADLFDEWAAGSYIPFFFSRPKVESVTERRIQLAPEGN